MNQKKIFITIGIFWIVILGGYITLKGFTLQTGYELILKPNYVSSREDFRGNYVTFRYRINDIYEDDEIPHPPDYRFEEGKEIYLILHVHNDRIGKPAAIAREKPDGCIFIKGKIVGKEVDTYSRKNISHIEYGIERYFVPKGKEKEIIENIEEIYVKILLEYDGNARIKSLVHKLPSVPIY